MNYRCKQKRQMLLSKTLEKRTYTIHHIHIHTVSQLMGRRQYVWKWAHINTSHTSINTGRRKSKETSSEWALMEGCRVTDSRQTERERRMVRGNRKGQVLREKLIVKDKAMRAGSVLWSWVASPLTTSETSSESQANNQVLYLSQFAKMIQWF